jgi:hypothetical protein
LRPGSIGRSRNTGGRRRAQAERLKETAMPIKPMPFDSAQYLKTEADIAGYLEAVLEANDPALRSHALTQIARTRAAIRRARKDRSC